MWHFWEHDMIQQTSVTPVFIWNESEIRYLGAFNLAVALTSEIAQAR